MSRMLPRTTVAILAASVAAAPMAAQVARPAPVGPVNVIRPSDPTRDAAADTSPTIFYAGGRPPRDPAVDPRPGDDLVVWRSSTLVRGVAGSDPGFMLSMSMADQAARLGRPPAPYGLGAAGALILPGAFGGWWGGPAGPPSSRASLRRLADQLPRAWIGGESGVVPSPVLEPTVPATAAPIPSRARPRP